MVRQKAVAKSGKSGTENVSAHIQDHRQRKLVYFILLKIIMATRVCMRFFTIPMYEGQSKSFLPKYEGVKLEF